MQCTNNRLLAYKLMNFQLLPECRVCQAGTIPLHIHDNLSHGRLAVIDITFNLKLITVNFTVFYLKI